MTDDRLYLQYDVVRADEGKLQSVVWQGLDFESEDAALASLAYTNSALNYEVFQVDIFDSSQARPWPSNRLLAWKDKVYKQFVMGNR